MRARAVTPPLRRRAPQHSRALDGRARPGLWPLFSCAGPRHDVAPLSTAPPWPCRGGLLRARGRREGNAVLFGQRVHTSPPAATPTHTRLCPTAVTLSAATLWHRPELRHGLRRPATLRPTPGLSLSRSHPYIRAPPSAPTRTRVRAHPRQSGRSDRATTYRRHADAAVPTMASTSPRRSPPS
jgi:hypothetical protein